MPDQGAARLHEQFSGMDGRTGAVFRAAAVIVGRTESKFRPHVEIATALWLLQAVRVESDLDLAQRDQAAAGLIGR
jgi:hypothetical protein